jgi:hypothetical protein
MSDSEFFALICTHFRFFSLFSIALLTVSCSAVTTMSDADALKTLRDLTKGNKLPPEGVVADIENRFAKPGRARSPDSYARVSGSKIPILTGRRRFSIREFFARKRTSGLRALAARARSCNRGQSRGGDDVFRAARVGIPTSLRAREAKILWATSAMQSGQAARIPAFLQELNEKIRRTRSFGRQNPMRRRAIRRKQLNSTARFIFTARDRGRQGSRDEN